MARSLSFANASAASVCIETDYCPCLHFLVASASMDMSWLSTEVQTAISVIVAAGVAVVVGYYFEILPATLQNAVTYGLAAAHMPRNMEVMCEQIQEFASSCAELMKAVTSFDRQSRDIQNAASGLSAELEKWVTGQQKEYTALADPIKQGLKNQGILESLARSTNDRIDKQAAELVQLRNTLEAVQGKQADGLADLQKKLHFIRQQAEKLQSCMDAWNTSNSWNSTSDDRRDRDAGPQDGGATRAQVSLSDTIPPPAPSSPPARTEQPGTQSTPPPVNATGMPSPEFVQFSMQMWRMQQEIAQQNSRNSPQRP